MEDKSVLLVAGKSVHFNPDNTNRASNFTSASRASAFSQYEEMLTPYHKFDNWMWLDSHLKFEEEAHKPGLIKSNESIKIIRGFNLAINVAVYAL